MDSFVVVVVVVVVAVAVVVVRRQLELKDFRRRLTAPSFG